MKKGIYSALLFLLVLMMPGCQEKKAALDDSKIVVGTNAEYEPFEYLDDDGELTGFDVELVNAIGQELGVEIEWIDMAFDSLIGAMEAGNVEMIAAAVAPTADRARSCDFSDVYYDGYQSIVVMQESDITDLDDLTGKTIAVLEGSLSDMIASGENQDYGVIDGAAVKRFKNATQAVQELENGAADAVLADSIIAERFIRERPELKLSLIETTGEDTVFGIRKGDTALVEAINKALGALKANGIYDQLYDKYFGE